jgi:hypothetical protein
VPGDRRGRLVVRGVAASASNSFYAIRHRVARSAWFVLLGVLPDRGVKWLLSWYAPDGPIMGR